MALMLLADHEGVTGTRRWKSNLGYMYGVHIGLGKTSARVHRCISTLLCREVIIDHRRQTDIYPGAVWTYGNKPGQDRTLGIFGVGNIHVRYFGKSLWIWFQKCLLLNHNSEKNLSQFVSQNLRCIPSQIIQITSHFAMRYRGNRSLFFVRRSSTLNWGLYLHD